MIHAEKATRNHDEQVDIAGRCGISVQRMCELLEVSRSGYYAWAGRLGAEPSARAKRQADLLTKIATFHRDSDRVYGAPRITADLRDAGEVVSVKTVAKIMRANGIAGICPRPFTPVTTITDGSAHTIPDRVGRRFDQGALNRVWTSDLWFPPNRGGLPLSGSRGEGRGLVGDG